MADTIDNDKPSRRKKFIKFIFIKFPIILLVLIGALYVTLKLIERYPVPLREGFEQHLSQVTGANASIGSLEKFSFVPTIHVDLRDITIHRAGNAAQIDIKAEKIKLVTPFWNAILGMNKFKEIEVSNVTAKQNALLPQSLTVKEMGVVERDGESYLAVDGTYSKKAFYLEVDLDKKNDVYKMNKNTPVQLTFDGATLTGVLERKLLSVDLTEAVLRIGDDASVPSDFVLVESEEYIKDNPLACLIINGEMAACQQYLKAIESVTEQ